MGEFLNFFLIAWLSYLFQTAIYFPKCTGFDKIIFLNPKSFFLIYLDFDIKALYIVALQFLKNEAGS